MSPALETIFGCLMTSFTHANNNKMAKPYFIVSLECALKSDIIVMWWQNAVVSCENSHERVTHL